MVGNYNVLYIAHLEVTRQKHFRVLHAHHSSSVKSLFNLRNVAVPCTVESKPVVNFRSKPVVLCLEKHPEDI